MMRPDDFTISKWPGLGRLAVRLNFRGVSSIFPSSNSSDA